MKSTSKVQRSEHHFCDRKCYGKWLSKTLVGPTAVNWRGGTYINHEGYRAKMVEQGGRYRYALEHRLVMEEKIGRHLLPYEIVHHKNGVKTDNRPENLELWAYSHPGQRPHDAIAYLVRYHREQVEKAVRSHLAANGH